MSMTATQFRGQLIARGMSGFSLVTLLAAVASVPAFAGTLNWQGGNNAASGPAAGSPVWSLPANWTQGNVPATGDSVDFGSFSTSNLTSVVDSTYSLNTISFSPASGDNSSQAFTVTLFNAAGARGIVNLSSGITSNTTAKEIISANNRTTDTAYIALTGNNVWTVSNAAGSLEVDSNIHLSSNSLTLSGAGSSTLNGQIFGAGSLTYNGTGTLTVMLDANNPNFFSGGTTISSGTLTVKGGGSLGTGTIANNSLFTIDAGNGTSFFATQAITGTGSVKVLSGLVTLTNSGNVYSGGTTITGGSVFVGSPPQSSSLGSGPVNNSSLLAFQASSSAGSSSLTNTGTLQFNFTSTAGSAQIQNSGTLSFNQSATAGSATITNTSLNLNFNNNSSAGTAIITNSGSVNFFDNSTADTATIKGGGVNIGSYGGSGVGIGSLSGSGLIMMGAKTLTLGGLGLNDTLTGTLADSPVGGVSGKLVKTGAGSLTLTGNNTYSGGTTISQGSIVARGGTVNGSGVLTGGGLGTGTVTIASGAILSVGFAPNTLATPQATGSLTISALAVTLGSSSPLLTFNLGSGGTSDFLTLTASGTELTTTGSGAFRIGFSSAAGAGLAPGSYLLLGFSTPQTLASLPSLSTFDDVALGNVSGLNDGNTFTYQTSGGLVTGLVYSVSSAPEPGSLNLLLMSGFVPLGCGIRRLRRRRLSPSGNYLPGYGSTLM